MRSDYNWTGSVGEVVGHITTKEIDQLLEFYHFFFAEGATIPMDRRRRIGHDRQLNLFLSVNRVMYEYINV